MIRILTGDCLETLKTLPDASVHCCVTSPPYFGLRDYGVDGQLGLEPTPDEFVQALVEVFREVRRVLTDDGTLWLNLGDSYARTGGTDRKVSASAKVGSTRNTMKQMGDRTGSAASLGLKDKDLIGIPWRVAFALQADGWYLRQDIIWHKPNPMPESVRDRCTKAHEYIFLLSKSPRYYFDHEAIKEPAVSAGRVPGGSPGRYIQPSAGGNNRDGMGTCAQKPVGELRNKRSVWAVSTKPYKGAHFATAPTEWVETCIVAGTPPGGTVLCPFGGSGTVAGAALKHFRNSILCELNPEYVSLMPGRISAISGVSLSELSHLIQYS